MGLSKETAIRKINENGIVSIVMGGWYDEEDNLHSHTILTQLIWNNAIEQNLDVVYSNEPDVVNQVFLENDKLVVEVYRSGEVEYRDYKF